jgi:Helix-turn-helix of insertion element transposase
MPLTEAQLRAAELLADDQEIDQTIARKCGVSRRTLARWKRYPEFAAEVLRQEEEHSRTFELERARESEAEFEEMISRLRASKRWALPPKY